MELRRRRSAGFAGHVERCIRRMQRTVKIDTQSQRDRWISELDELFMEATSIAKGKVTRQQVGDKLQSIPLKERQMWAQAAANIGMVMGNLSKQYDVVQIDKDLDALERKIKEINEEHARTFRQSNTAAQSEEENTDNNTDS